MNWFQLALCPINRYLGKEENRLGSTGENHTLITTSKLVSQDNELFCKFVKLSPQDGRCVVIVNCFIVLSILLQHVLIFYKICQGRKRIKQYKQWQPWPAVSEALLGFKQQRNPILSNSKIHKRWQRNSFVPHWFFLFIDSVCFQMVSVNINETKNISFFF